MNILTLNNISKRFGDKSVLNGLSMEVPEHTVFGFVGQNVLRYKLKVISTT